MGWKLVARLSRLPALAWALIVFYALVLLGVFATPDCCRPGPYDEGPANYRPY